MDKKLNNPIENIFENIVPNSSVSSELFTEGDISLKTELNNDEQVILSCLCVENNLINGDLTTQKRKVDIYGDFIKTYMRLKVSLDRKSRKEFVDSLNKNNTDKDFERLSNLKNLTEVRK